LLTDPATSLFSYRHYAALFMNIKMECDSKESEEIKRPTGAAGKAGQTASSAAAVAVGACENELPGEPQEGQNL
jgi:hypothetical protein